MSYRAYWLALPALIILATFVFLPLASVIRYASWDWSGVSDPDFVGWGNVKRMLADPELWRSLKATLFFALITIPVFLWLSRSIAIAIEGVRLERFIKALLFMPNLITVGGSAIAWYLLYEPDYGFLAEFSRYFYFTYDLNLPCEIEFSRYFTKYLPFEWKSLSLPCNGLVLPWRDAAWAGIVYVVLFTLWQIVGYGVLVTSAALKGIPEGSKEAARVDGATERQIKRYIVEPLLRPTLVFLIVIATVFSLQSYTAVFFTN